MKKEFIAGALSLTLLAGLFPAGAVGFPDVADPETAEATEILRQLGVISGLPDGTYNPSGTFTRAEFCKMALTILGRGSEAALQKGRVIFTDVTGDHWALGYINAAASVPSDKDATALVQGKGDGTFAPNDAITAGEAVAILIRSLGYSDQDVAMAGAWYAGHMAKAEAIGLLDGLEGLNGGETLDRGQAAELFENLLFVKAKNADDIFLVTHLGGEVAKSQLLLSVGDKPLASGGYAVKTDAGTYKTLRNDLGNGLRGQRCKPVLDPDGNVLALRQDEDYTTRTVRIIAAESRYLVTQQQEQILVPSATPVWRENAAEGTYGALYAKDIPYGATAVLCYDSTDTLASIYLLGDSDSAITAVVGADGTLTGIVPDANVSVYRNGLTSSLSALKPYDVVTYDAAAGVLTATDNKLTGVYEDASPSPISPATITVMGCELMVLDSALASLSQFGLGDQMTLFLDENNAVAAVVSPRSVSAQALGVASITAKQNEKGKTIYTASAELANGLTVKGEVSANTLSMEAAPGRLTLISSAEAGKLTLKKVEESSPSAAWNVSKNTLGNLTVSPEAVIYEKVGNSAIRKLKTKNVTLSSVPADKITYVHQDAAGIVDCLLLEDMTGDCYTYGVVSKFTSGSGGSGMYDFTNSGIVLENGGGETSLVCSAAYEKYEGKYMGFTASLSTVDGTARVGSLLVLQNAGSVRRSAFTEDSVKVSGKIYPLDERIDDLCYNAKTDQWFASLDEALAYSSRLTVYCDKSPEQGGKIRLVVIE